jgi:arginine/lysine/ornithine decarboxylase
MCCDSAHKTLPVLTGGAYLHLAGHLPSQYAANAKNALALFGSTSPSYLIMASLDLCNNTLAENYAERLAQTVACIGQTKQKLTQAGWQVEQSDPLRITIRAPQGCTGTELTDRLRRHGIECEYADRLFVVLMLTPNNGEKELEQLVDALGTNSNPQAEKVLLPQICTQQAVSIRQAMFLPHESVAVQEAEGRICGTPAVSCPPAIPIVISGERITRQAIELFGYYDICQVDVLK